MYLMDTQKLAQQALYQDDISWLKETDYKNAPDSKAQCQQLIAEDENPKYWHQVSESINSTPLDRFMRILTMLYLGSLKTTPLEPILIVTNN
jgi:hypothetical protein